MTRAFLIGAGATRAQYQLAPLNSDFFKLLRKHSELYAEIRKLMQPYLEEDLNQTDVEDAMLLASERPQSIREHFLENIYLAIYYLLGEPTESDNSNMNHFFHTSRTPPTLFKRLVNDNRLNSEDFFMTLNYDLYLDREILSTHDISIDYGIPREYYDDSYKAINLLSEQYFSVYHLHGSLNWLWWDDKIRIDVGAIKPKVKRSKTNLCLVPPGDKELPPVLRGIWSTAESRLIYANELIVIGCSLNPKDAALINLVKKFIDEKGAGNVKIIYRGESSETWKDGRPLPIKKGSKYERYLRITGEQFKAYPYGFNLNGPPNNPDYGALEFIFK